MRETLQAQLITRAVWVTKGKKIVNFHFNSWFRWFSLSETKRESFYMFCIWTVSRNARKVPDTWHSSVGDFKTSQCQEAFESFFCVGVSSSSKRFLFRFDLLTGSVWIFLVTQQRQKDPQGLHGGCLGENFITDLCSRFDFFKSPSLHSKLQVESQPQPRLTQFFRALRNSVLQPNTGVQASASRSSSGTQRPPLQDCVFILKRFLGVIKFYQIQLDSS